jgi:hypothetical protein
MGTLLRDASLTWLLSLPTWGVNVDGLACLMHRPTAYGRQMRGHGFLPGVVLSHHVAKGSGALLGDTQPPSLDICGGV